MNARTSPVRVGLIGLGNSGWFYHAEAHLARSAEFALTAVCSRDERRAREAATRFGGHPYTDWRRVVERPDVELVVVALPHDLHGEVARAAIDAGRHVLVEKPLAPTVAECDELVAAAERAGVLLTVHQQRRWERDFLALRETLADGAIGRPWRFDVARTHAGRYRTVGDTTPHTGADVLDWPHERARGGGISYLVGPHPVDQLLHLADARPLDVSGWTHVSDGDDVDDHVALDVRFEGGVLGRVDVFRQALTAPPRFTVYGTGGTVVARDGRSLEVHPTAGEPRVVDGIEPPGRHGHEIYAGLYRAIRHGDRLPVTAAGARTVVEVLELGLRSAELGGQRMPLRTVAAP